MQTDQQETSLFAGKTWVPTNGEPTRQIQEMRVANAWDHPHRQGTILVCWASAADQWGWCTAQSFKAWIRRTKARLA